MTDKTEPNQEVIPASDTNPALATHDPQILRIAERAAMIAAETEWDLPLGEDGKPLLGTHLDEWLVEKGDSAAVNMVERGIGFALKKAELSHGMFMAWIKDHDLSQATVNQEMRAAQLFLSLDSANSLTLTNLPPSHMKALSFAPKEIVNEMLASGEINKDSTVRSIRENIKLKKQLRKAHEANAELADAFAHEREKRELAEHIPQIIQRTNELRASALEESAHLRAVMAQLDLLVEELDELPDGMKQAELASIGAPLLTELHSIRVGATVLLHRAQQGLQRLGLQQREDIPYQSMTPEELARYAALYDRYQAQAELRAHRLKSSNDYVKPKKRGRPAKK